VSSVSAPRSIAGPTFRGLTREGLYKALSKDGNPGLGTVLKVMHALGLKFTATAARVRTNSAVDQISPAVTTFS
jgi:hypothetical protein